MPRNKVFTYASSITTKLVEAMHYRKVDFDNIYDMASFIDNIHIVQNTSYKARCTSINFENMTNGQKDTIEFRLPNGTIDADAWIDNINLFGGLMWASKRVVDARRKPISKLNKEDKRCILFYEKIADESVSDRDRLKYLLNLLPSGINKKIYLNRYDVNSELVKGMDMEEILDDISFFRPIEITTCPYDIKDIVDSNNVYKTRKKLIRKG